ncbi:malate dehydrogenase (quinone) [Trypanosoma rangeli]|uniref:Malate dehydrogenase (Quinone) n=1 Tax=Trypanosoma rangeli TaxID=5698 RepID=A0A422N1C1_TRYRA|nr:malate dehydrogenase (quinone) [Trypanosoma rangeli]RNE99243.1 malate dehydrogenase (quinone) [Trypanosoma rangeli]|eukprot:RNE99243.1 malate dehydrogenase (quinone) [Trypanosoma rangeli]
MIPCAQARHAMSGQGPTVNFFRYVLIPADDNAAPREMTFAGGSDEEFRASLQQYFRRQLLSEDQRREMARHLTAKMKEAKQQGDAAAAAAAATSEQQQHAMIEDYLEQTSFEIIPLLMPGRGNRFVGTSLYIDDSGRFKDLALNSRASTLVQRDIRGDAFLLCSHDDPALDEWSRVDCTLAHYEALLREPPTTSYDTANQAQMTSAVMQRESDTKRISEADTAKAQQAKVNGNSFFTAGDFKAAVKAYDEAVELTEGRRDLLPNEAAVTALRLSALLNRSLCHHRLGKNEAAAADARAALQLDATNLKAHHRLAVALCGGRDYAAAAEALNAFEQLGGPASDVAAIRQAIAEGAAALRKEQKQKFSKLFA